MKRIVFLIIASLLVVGLVLPSTAGADNPTVKILIAGPMTMTQGTDMWAGAELAANQINDAGGVSVNGTPYDIELVKVETNEVAVYDQAGILLQSAIDDNLDAQYIIGGFRTEGVEYELPVAMSNNITMFITGAASYDLLAKCPIYPYVPAYGGYQYAFRGTPFNDVFLLANSFMMLGMVAMKVAAEGVTPRVGVFAESLSWADPIVEGAETLIPALAGIYGWELGVVKRVSDTASSTQVDSALNAMEADEDNIIWTVTSGTVGTTFSLRKGQLDIPAIAVGINVQAQAPDFWTDSLGGCAYEIVMGTWAEGVVESTQTLDFLSDFQTEYGHFPMYTAASYDVLKVLATAMHEVGSVDNEDLISWYEDPDNAKEISSGVAGYYPVWQYGTWGYWESAAGEAPYEAFGQGDGILPALTEAQITQIYGDSSHYSASCNFTMPPYTTHDLIYGPDYVTGIACQWQPVVTP